jgi:deoxyadenosine/deoxycytidine kinase
MFGNEATALRSENGTCSKVPRVVEIVGPAGAGKTSLCQAMVQSSQGFRESHFPDVRKPSDAPFFVWNGLQLLPRVLRLTIHSDRRLSRRKLAWLCILNGWPTVLRKEMKTRGQVIVLDQGPVFLLTEICELAPHSPYAESARKMWRTLYGRWASVLDAIVWLDTNDRFLLQRIRTRNKPHPVKDESAEKAIPFLDRYRVAYEHCLSLLRASNPYLQILRFDTNSATAAEIANDLVDRFGLSA